MEQSWSHVRSTIARDIQRSVGDRPFALFWFVRLGVNRSILTYRLGRWASSASRRRVVRMILGLIARSSTDRRGIELPFGTEIGPGLKILHAAGGTVVNAGAKIGDDCTIVGSVTIGAKRESSGELSAPVIGDGVQIGVGARIIGGIHVGDGAHIGANAVVVNDVEAGSVVGGIPARPLKPASGTAG